MTELSVEQRLKKLLNELVDIYSPSGKEEEVLEYVHDYLKSHGLPVERQEVDDNRYNLVVFPPDNDIELALVGHLDTVVAYDLDHYGFEEEDGTVSGLGTADMKGGCAAMIEAMVSAWKENTSPPPVGLCLVVGEEEEGDGAIQLVKDYQFPWAIIGEPTDLRPCLSNYGYLELQVESHGKRAHASLADQVRNPLRVMLRIVLKIVRYLESERPQVVYNIRDMWSSQAGFFIPDHCEAWLDLHIPPQSSIAEVMQEIEDILDQDREERPDQDAGIRFATIDAGFELPEKGHIVEALQAGYSRTGVEWAPVPFRSHSDATRLWEAGVRPVILGPGKLEMAHSPEESIQMDQVQKVYELYREIIKEVAST